MVPPLYPDIHSQVSVSPASHPTPRQFAFVRDVIIRVFYFYRVESLDGVNWNLERWWHRLTHVCREWRHLILSHPSHLNLHLVCTYATPITDLLALSLPFPLVVNYPNKNEITTEDEENLLVALQHRNRVYRISLATPITISSRVIAAMGGDFPQLRHLRITGAQPSLTTLTADRLVSLTIRCIPPSHDSHPGFFATLLSSMPLLVTISLGFRSPVPNHVVEKQLLNLPTTSITLSHLSKFMFRGVSSFLEGLVARMDAPHLRAFRIVFFNQLTFPLPHLSSFIRRTQRLKFPIARVNFHKHNMSILADHSGPHRDDNSLHITVDCRYLDWQVDAAAQICNAVALVLSSTQELTLGFRKHGASSDYQGEVILTRWNDVLSPFTHVEVLRVHHKLAGQLSRALGPDEGICLHDILPRLREIVVLPSRRNYGGAFVALLNTCRDPEHPICSHLPSQLPIDKQPSKSLSPTDPKMTSVSSGISAMHPRIQATTSSCTPGSRFASSPNMANLPPVLKDTVYHSNRMVHCPQYTDPWPAHLVASDGAYHQPPPLGTKMILQTEPNNTPLIHANTITTRRPLMSSTTQSRDEQAIHATTLTIRTNLAWYHGPLPNSNGTKLLWYQRQCLL